MELQVLQCGLRAQLREVQVERARRFHRCSTALERPRQHDSIGHDPGGRKGRSWGGRGGEKQHDKSAVVCFVLSILLELV